ncbi:MAG: dihydrodipicolinate synthase family protein [Candidatus Micrarchaeia archaeon]
MNYPMKALQGIIVPLATPLTPREEVDQAGMRRLVRHVSRGGANALFVLGSTGEFACLDSKQKRKAVEAVVDANEEKLPVLAGVTACSTKKAVQLARDAEKAGADAVVCAPPYYYQLPQEKIIEHFQAVAKATNLPVIAYNFPQTTKNALEVATLKKLSSNSCFIGLKDSSGDENYLTAVANEFQDSHFKVFQGNENALGQALVMGCAGGVPSLANVFPRECAELWNAFKKMDFKAVHAAQEKIIELQFVYGPQKSKVIAGIKTALNYLGVCGKTVSAPLPTLSPAEEKTIVRALQTHLREYKYWK